MTTPPLSTNAAFVLFEGHIRIAGGDLATVAVEAARILATRPETPLLAFEAATGGVVDLDTRGGEAEVRVRYAQGSLAPSPAPRGRPRLGVVAREVTLLPRQWDWLARQPGSASVTLRRLLDAAQKADGGQSEAAARREAAYRFMSALAGDLPGFEEASRALFRADLDGLDLCMADWPHDIRHQAMQILRLNES